MDSKYLVVLDAKDPEIHFHTVDTDDFEEVNVVVNQWMWNFSDGHIWVYKKTSDGEKVIKHIILKKVV